MSKKRKSTAQDFRVQRKTVLFDNVPDEIGHMILTKLEGKKDVCNSRLVCRKFCAILQPAFTSLCEFWINVRIGFLNGRELKIQIPQFETTDYKFRMAFVRYQEGVFSCTYTMEHSYFIKWSLIPFNKGPMDPWFKRFPNAVDFINYLFPCKNLEEKDEEYARSMILLEHPMGKLQLGHVFNLPYDEEILLTLVESFKYSGETH